jgi:hypothetical protein
VEAVTALIADAMTSVHTAFPAKVTAYDAAKQTVEVQPQIRRWLLEDDGTLVHEDLPVLVGIPVAFPRGGGFHMSFPLAAGDFVLVICSDHPTVAWRTSGDVSNAGIAERHGLNGCFALPCGYPDTEALSPAPSGSDLVLSSDNGSTVLSMDASGNVNITGTLTVTGDISTDGEVTAMAATTNVSLATHTHPSGTGPTGSPTPGS